jgi:hypothetical protein
MSTTSDLCITNILDIIKLLNNSDEIIKYFNIVYNKFWLKTTILHEMIAKMYTINFKNNKALTKTDNAINKAIENIKIVKPLKISKYPDFDKLWADTINSLIIVVKKALYFEVIAKTYIVVTQAVMKTIISTEDTNIEAQKKTLLMNKLLVKNEELAKMMYSLAKLMRTTNTLKTLGALAENTLKKALIIRNMQKLHNALFMIVNIVTFASTITIEIVKQTQLSSFIKMVNKLDEATIVTNNAIINAIIIKNTNQTEINEAASALLIIADIPNKHKPNKQKFNNMDVKITMTANAIREAVNCIYTIYSVVLLAEKEVQKVKSQYILHNMMDIC